MGEMFMTVYTATYHSPMGEITMAASEEALIALWLEGQKPGFSGQGQEIVPSENAVLKEARAWLDRYFRGERPLASELNLAPAGSGFARRVWSILLEIPYGQTVTYGQIAQRIAGERRIKRMSAQAVGGAVGSNPIAIIIPCHRVIGSHGNLTGYAGGLDKKIALLCHEGAMRENFYVPRKKALHHDI